MRPGETALVILTPELEEIVGTWRARYDPMATRGVPSHVSLLYPWVSSPTSEDVDRARSAIASVRPFEVVFRRLARFPDVLFLVPEDEGELEALAQALFSGFPEHKPYGGRHEAFVPHLTISQTTGLDLDRLELEISTDLHPHLPTIVQVRDVAILEEQANGTWEVRQQMSLEA